MKIVFTDQALVSINAAFDFLAWQEIPKERIEVIFERIFNRIETLAQMPYIGQREYLTSDPDRSYRRIVESHFKVIYYIYNDTIFIADIFDSRQDPLTMKG